jgi:hypothetical protein
MIEYPFTKNSGIGFKGEKDSPMNRRVSVWK